MSLPLGDGAGLGLRLGLWLVVGVVNQLDSMGELRSGLVSLGSLYRTEFCWLQCWTSMLGFGSFCFELIVLVRWLGTVLLFGSKDWPRLSWAP